MLNEHEEEEKSLKKKNPYELLRYINCLAKFYQEMKSNISYGNIEGFMSQIIKVTEKYNK